MKHPVWFVVLVALLAVGLVALAGCSHKRAESGGPSTDVGTTPPATQNPDTSTSTPSGSEGDDTERASGYADVYFAYNDASLDDAARQVLAKNSAKLSGNTERIEVQGHCDERGSVEYNLALGERRAVSVRDYLVSYGVKAARISTVSYGKERPADPGHDEDAWARNRRAHTAVK